MAIDKSSLSVVQCWSSNVDGLEIADRRILFIKDKKLSFIGVLHL